VSTRPGRVAGLLRELDARAALPGETTADDGGAAARRAAAEERARSARERVARLLAGDGGGGRGGGVWPGGAGEGRLRRLRTLAAAQQVRGESGRGAAALPPGFW
jgi:hypothetical protein